MGYARGRLGAAARRVRVHRTEAVAVFGLAGAVTVTMRFLLPTLAPDGLGHGWPAGLLFGAASMWLPLMIIDSRRCGRETALRQRVEGDLTRQRAVLRRRAHLTATARERIGDLLLDGGPTIVYQPVIRLGAATVVGFEALSRFPDGAAPGDWFATAASVGLGPELQLAAIRNALTSLPALPAGCYLSVNVGPDTLPDPELETLLGAVPAGRVVLELTEHRPVHDYVAHAEVLARLRRLGVRLAVDDAGAGYSSFRHIVQLSPELIKLDRTLVQDVDRDPVRRSLLAAMVTFAADLGAVLIAEGVETPAEAEALADCGVACAQGYLFGRPGPLPPRYGTVAAAQLVAGTGREPVRSASGPGSTTRNPSDAAS